jgi:glycerophosphoryl diester phosphodiesterase
MARRSAWFTVGLVLVTVYIGLLLRARPMPDHPFFPGEGPLAIAHRGGSGLWPENTLYAFRRAVDLGVDVIEMDIHSTVDDVLVIMHDPTVDRTTNGEGAIRDLTLAEIQALDAGYGWSSDGGASFPFRGRGIQVPTLEEIFDSFPETRMNIEIKQNSSLVASLCRMLRDFEMEERVLVASFDGETMRSFREACPEVATSAASSEVRWFVRLNYFFLGKLYRADAHAFQVPDIPGNLEIVTPRFVKDAHGHNVQVHVWTVNEADQMERLLELGVDGILTDYPDRLLTLLGR